MKYTHYKQVDAEVDRLYADQQYDQILALMDEALEQFPEYRQHIGCNRIVIYARMGNYPAALAAIEWLHHHGTTCPVYYWQIFAPLKDLPRSQEIEAENKRLIELARSTSKMQYVVHLPEGYSPQQRYPLFIVLHGDGQGGNIEFQSWYWEPEMMLKHNMVVVYIQSSQVYYTDNFGWLRDYSLAHKEIRACYDQVMTQYAIDPHAIYIGGYSGGAIMSTEIALSQALPVRGWVGLCPEIKPPSFTHENLLKAVQLGMKCVFLEGEEKALLPDEQEMVNAFDNACLPYQLYINPGIGHIFPADFDEKLDRAIEFITS